MSLPDPSPDLLPDPGSPRALQLAPEAPAGPRRAGVGTWVRAAVVAPLLVAPAAALPTLAASDTTHWIWAGELALALLAIGFLTGQAAAVRTTPVLPADVARTLAFPLSSITRVVALVLLVAGAAVAFAPSNLQFGKPAPVEKSATLPAASEVGSVRTVSGPLGAHLDDGQDSFVVSDNPVNAKALAVSAPPPAGFRWVSVVVRMTGGTRSIDVLHASIRLVDDHDRSYLPDMGEGVQNAVLGVVHQGETAFWTPGYLVPVGLSPARVVITTHPGATVEVAASFPARTSSRTPVGQAPAERRRTSTEPPSTAAPSKVSASAPASR